MGGAGGDVEQRKLRIATDEVVQHFGGAVLGDRVRMHNDVGSCELLASVAPSVQPGQVIVYHGWEPLSFKDWKGNQEPVPSVWKSLHMLQYGQLHYQFLFAGPHHTPRGTTVEVERA
mgnify:CR=1 FL=1